VWIQILIQPEISVCRFGSVLTDQRTKYSNLFKRETSHAADAFRYLALTLDRRATLSGFYRHIEYPQHGVV
jgi:hypothetical protein